MSGQTLEFSTLEGYVAHEAERWRQWFAEAQPEVLDLPLGPNADGTIRTLVKHIFAVELRYAQRLAGQPVSAYEDMPDQTVADLWRIHADARRVMQSCLAGADAEAMNAVLVSDTRKLGRIESRAHTVVLHSWIHGIRHWAQIATTLRQHGHPQPWGHDLLFSDALR